MRHLALICVLASATSAQTAVTITAHPDQPGITIPRDFIGLSFETGSLTSATGFAAENPVFRQMALQIGPGLARFGGNSVDKLTGWTRAPRTSSTGTSILTSSDADRVFAWARAVGWRVLWSLDLGMGDPATDADEAAYVYQTASDVLAGLEIGNEPDLYHSNGLRPSTYNITSYLQEWKTYADAIQAQTPQAVLTGSAASGSITTWTAPFAQQEGSRIALLTQHLYPLAPYANNPNASNAATIAHILGATARSTEDSDGAQLLTIAQGQKIPWRMAETNSSYNGGQSGVSDVFASALWGVDYMFTLAARGAAGVNFHGGGTGAYTPIAVSSSGQVSARPLYYALLMFRAAGRGVLVPLDVSANGVNLTAYGALDPDGTLRVIIINKDLAQDAAVAITPGPGYTTSLAMRLAAPAVDSTTGITLGGASVAADGTWQPVVLGGPVSGGSLNEFVPAVSATLIAFGNGHLGVSNSATGQATIAPNGLASAYGQALGMAEVQAPPGTALPALAGVSGTITDSAGVSRPLGLSYAGTSQVNFVVPSGAALGPATVQFGPMSAPVTVGAVAPGLFTMGGTTAAALAVRVPNGQSTQTAVPAFDCSSGSCVPVPISIDDQSTVYVSLYGTGIRGAAQSSVTCTVGGIPVDVTYAGPQGAFPGLDQVNIAIPSSLGGRGLVDVVITAAGQPSNAVRLEFGN